MSDYAGTDNLEIMSEAVNYNRFLLRLIRAVVRPEDRIVDIGAGIGTIAKTLAAEGYRVQCVEPDPRQAASIAEAGITVTADIDSIEDATVDVILSFNVLEHIEDDHGALRLWTQKLRSGGRMLVYVPAFQILFSSMDRKVGHFRRYTLGQLVLAARAAGLVVESARYADCAGFLATLLYKWFGSDTGEINRKSLVAFDRYVFPVSRAADRLFRSWLGKNAVVVARRAG